MSQCVRWTSSEEFDRLRSEITLGSCTSISCTCVSRVEPELELEWIQEDQIRTEVNGTLLTKEEVEKFGLNVYMKTLASERSENIVEHLEANILSGRSSTSEDEQKEELSKSDDTGLEVSVEKPRRRDSIYITSSSLESTKKLTRSLLGKEKRPSLSVSSPASVRHNVQTSYTQIWMCGRDKKKGLLAMFILPDNQKNIYVS